MSRAHECYITVAQAAFLIQFSERFVRDRIKENAFGPGSVFVIGNDVRIKASALNAWMEKHEYQQAPGIFARNEGELRRKVLEQSAA